VCDGFVMTAFTTWLYSRKLLLAKGVGLGSLYATVGGRLYYEFSEDELSKEKIRIWFAGAWISESSRK
jgi:hypothetical protein